MSGIFESMIFPNFPSGGSHVIIHLPGRLDGDFALRVRGSGPDLQVGLQGCNLAAEEKDGFFPGTNGIWTYMHGWFLW